MMINQDHYHKQDCKIVVMNEENYLSQENHKQHEEDEMSSPVHHHRLACCSCCCCCLCPSNSCTTTPHNRPRRARCNRTPTLPVNGGWLLVCLLLAAWSPASITHVQAVDCFKCSSRNGSNPACEDPFHNVNTTRVTLPILPEPQPGVIYHTPCYAGRKNREGLFPASACIKLTGVFDTTGETLVVRHCALDSGSLTQDTELARMSHCGKFQFEGDLLRGCVLACPEDACNSATRAIVVELSLLLPFFTITTSLLVSYYRHHNYNLAV